jgi:pimeloyl-ACP methyl ester carboxylesterase
MVRTGTLNKYGIGHLHNQELIQGMTFNGMVLKVLFGFKGYTLSEKINWFLGADFSMTYLFPVLLQDNFFESSVKFEIPFYIIHGVYDYMVSYTLAKEYFDVLETPKKEFFTFDNSAHSPNKEFFTFDNSAHSPNMEEPEKFIGIFRKIASENPVGK